MQEVHILQAPLLAFLSPFPLFTLINYHYVSSKPEHWFGEHFFDMKILGPILQKLKGRSSRLDLEIWITAWWKKSGLSSWNTASWWALCSRAWPFPQVLKDTRRKTSITMCDGLAWKEVLCRELYYPLWKHTPSSFRQWGCHAQFEKSSFWSDDLWICLLWRIWRVLMKNRSQGSSEGAAGLRWDLSRSVGWWSISKGQSIIHPGLTGWNEACILTRS
jgi:hypothetical protein